MMLNFQNALIMSSKCSLLWLAALLATACSSADSGEQKGKPSGAVPVTAALVKEQTITDQVNTSGNLLPRETATLRSQAAGEIMEIYFEEGERIERNQKLIRLDNRSLKAQLRSLKSDLKTAESELRRNQNLREVEGVSQSLLDESENRVETLRAQIDELEVMLDYTVIKAPFAGTIGLRTVSPGDYLAVGESIGQIVMDEKLRLKFNVPGHYARALQTGDTVKFEIRGQDSLFPARVFARQAQINAASRNLEVMAEVDNSSGIVTPGAFARVYVDISTFESALLVPSESLISGIDGQTVWIMKNGKAQNVQVKPGLRLTKTTQILSGVQPGDTVLTTGLLQIREGTPLRIKEIIKIDQK